MSTSSFDTHAFFNELKGAGFSEQQAEVMTKLQKTPRRDGACNPILNV